MPFFGIGKKTDHFQSWDYCWVFQFCWHIECRTFTALTFRAWSSSAGIPSPSLALFLVMLPKALLTSHSRMSGSRWMTTPLWISRSLRPFLYNYFVYSCHLFLISSASVSLPFLSFIMPILPWNVPLIAPVLLKNFPQFVVIYTVKGFGVVNKAEVMFQLVLPPAQRFSWCILHMLVSYCFCSLLFSSLHEMYPWYL